MTFACNICYLHSAKSLYNIALSRRVTVVLPNVQLLALEIEVRLISDGYLEFV